MLLDNRAEVLSVPMIQWVMHFMMYIFNVNLVTLKITYIINKVYLIC